MYEDFSLEKMPPVDLGAATDPSRQESEAPIDAMDVIRALDISALEAKRTLDEAPPSPQDPLTKRVNDFRKAKQMETDAKIAELLRNDLRSNG